MRISSPAFNEGETIPQEFTCAGQDTSPELQIDGVPEEARTLAIIMDDPDAPGGTFVHWLCWNISADWSRIPEKQPGSEREALEVAMEGHELASARVTGLFARK